jgi:hypothetical protein
MHGCQQANKPTTTCLALISMPSGRGRIGDRSTLNESELNNDLLNYDWTVGAEQLNLNSECLELIVYEKKRDAGGVGWAYMCGDRRPAHAMLNQV